VIQRLLYIALGVLLAVHTVYGQESRGAIEGTIVNGEDHQSLVGTTILLQGTVLGTTTNSDGRFQLHNLPVGEYTITFSMVGFQRKLLSHIKVRERDTTWLSVELVPVAIQTATVIVTANKHEQSLEEVEASVSVVDERALSYRNTITVDDALKYVPGVNVTQSQVNIRGSTGYSHGVGTRVLLLIDGLPFLSGDTGEIIWESIPVGEIERIEVVKGASSALYGSNALGGVINIITKTGLSRPETKLRLYAGMYEQPKYSDWNWSKESRMFTGVMASHQERIGKLNLVAGGSRTLDDGYKRNDFWRRWNLWARLGYDFSPTQSLALSFSFLDQRRGNFLYWKDLNHALEPQDDQLTQRVQSVRWSLGGAYRQFISTKLYTTLKFNWYRSRWEDNIPSTFSLSGSNSLSDFVVGEVQAGYAPSEKQILTGGISGSYNHVAADTIFGKHSLRGIALYLQDEIFYENFRFTLGSRFDYQKLEELESVSQFNPKFGIVCTPMSRTSLRASVGRGFRAPSIAETYTTTEAGGLIILPNPALMPERSWSYEVGGTYAMSEMFSTNLSLFRNEFWDLIEPAFGVDGYVHFLNITRARITGIEVTLNSNVFSQHLRNQVSYTYMNPEDLTHNDVLKYRPRHLVTASSQLSVDPILVGIDVRYISKTERIDQELQAVVPDINQLVPITVVDLRLGGQWKFGTTSLATSLQINNLFQYYYADFIGNLGPTRNYVLTMEVKL
jgi:outer membrane receptor for ferrienterochelin and colicins